MRDLSTLAAAFYRVKMCSQIDEIQRELKLRKKVTLFDPEPPKSTDRIDYSHLLRLLRRENHTG